VKSSDDIAALVDDKGIGETVEALTTIQLGKICKSWLIYLAKIVIYLPANEHIITYK
jgi:hypothetical protein